MSTARASLLAIALSASALAASAYLALARAKAPAGASPCACDEASVRREVEALRKEVSLLALRSSPAGSAPDGALDKLSARIAALEARAASPRTDSPDEPGADPSAHRPAAAPRVVSVSVPYAAVSMRVMPEGGFSITNTDPALTGKNMVVDLKREDGSTSKMTFTVPAPAPR